MWFEYRQEVQHKIFVLVPYWSCCVVREAYFHFIHAFGNGRRSYASEPVAKPTV